MEFKDPVMNAVVSLANETARAGYGVLVFSSSRAGCEADAVLISRVMPGLGEAEERVREGRMELLGDLRSLSTGLDEKLGVTVPVGVGFHRKFFLSFFFSSLLFAWDLVELSCLEFCRVVLVGGW